MGENPVVMALDDSHFVPKRLDLVARVDGSVVGGLLAETERAWLKVSIIAVAPEWRRRGIATRLMAAAEVEAVERGCRHVFLDTMDFQAPALYEHLGFRLVGVVEDWDSYGHTKHFYARDRASSN